MRADEIAFLVLGSPGKKRSLSDEPGHSRTRPDTQTLLLTKNALQNHFNNTLKEKDINFWQKQVVGSSINYVNEVFEWFSSKKQPIRWRDATSAYRDLK